jgi:creatinine deaminase
MTARRGIFGAPFEELSEPALVAELPGGTPSTRCRSWHTRAMDAQRMLEVALDEAKAGRLEDGIPIGSALFDASGALLGRGHNQRVQRDDPSAHAEVEAFRNAGRRRSYRDTIIATTLAPCWFCSGLIRQFGIGTVVVGESRTFSGGIEWLRECGVEVVDRDSDECAALLQAFIAERPEIWDEDIGE